MGWTPFVFATDIHGDMADTSACNALFRFMRDWKPRIRICGGDVFDLRAWRTKAAFREKQEDTEADFDAGLSFLDSFAPTHLLLGNHDIRLWDRANDADDKRIANYANELIGKLNAKLPRGCTTLPYHKRKGVLQIGKLRFIHGFPTHTGVTAAKRVASEYGSCLFGHGHAIDVASVPGIERRTAQMVGCLCQLDMDYNHTTVSSLRYANGWAYGAIHDNSGEFQVFQAENVGGKYVVSSGFREIAA